MFQFPKIFSLHKETQKPLNIPIDDKEWPDSWKIVEFKEYPRLPKVALPEPGSIDGKLQDILKNRMSRRNFDLEGTISSKNLSTLLFWSAGLRTNKDQPERSFRFYPSGGARYPLEVYFYFRGNKDISEGVYHYNVKNHYLEGMEKLIGDDGANKIKSLNTYAFAHNAALLFFVTGIFDRSMRKYKERGYRFVLIEHGILLESFYIISGALGLGCCGVGTIFDNLIEEYFKLEPSYESFIGSFAIGPLTNSNE